MVPIWLTGSKIFYHPRKSEGPRKMSPRSQEEWVLSIPGGADRTGQQPHIARSRAKSKLLFNLLPLGSHNYPQAAANVHKHLCSFLLLLQTSLEDMTENQAS